MLYLKMRLQTFVCTSCVILCITWSNTEAKQRKNSKFDFYEKSPDSTDASRRNGKFFSIFTIIRFKNDACNGTTSTEQGICLTSTQCNSEGGMSIGTCAIGFGVCCQIAKKSCGDTVTRNCTFIQNPNYPGSEPGSQTCSYTINKCADNICFYRLDMVKNTIADQNINSPIREIKGSCQIDTMTTSCSSGTGFPDTFCGVNDGQHAYLSVQSQRSCQINFNLGAGAANERAWKIKVSQIECDSIVAPPAGCLQYFWGASGGVCSYGFKDDPVHIHLNNQLYSICIRMEFGRCSITYTTPPSLSRPFRISQPEDSANVDDCLDQIVIPNAQGASSAPTNRFVSSFCGGRFATTVGTTFNEAVTTSTKPFRIGVFLDEKEGAGGREQNGFCLDYHQNAC